MRTCERYALRVLAVGKNEHLHTLSKETTIEAASMAALGCSCHALTLLADTRLWNQLGGVAAVTGFDGSFG